ncbi:MAG: hypothetical protein Q9223_002247 [Gallowayella weberi]
MRGDDVDANSIDTLTIEPSMDVKFESPSPAVMKPKTQNMDYQYKRHLQWNVLARVQTPKENTCSKEDQDGSPALVTWSLTWDLGLISFMSPPQPGLVSFANRDVKNVSACVYERLVSCGMHGMVNSIALISAMLSKPIHVLLHSLTVSTHR